MDKLKKLAYSMGAVATSLSYQAFGAYVVFFYLDVMRLGVQLVAIAMIIWGIWNAINDPLFGFISDRTKTKWGRRIPYIAATAVPFGLIYYFLWSPPFTFAEQASLFFYFFALICLFDLCYTIIVLNWSSLFPEMFRDLKERAEVNSYRQFFGVIGLIIGIAIPPLIYSRLGWQAMGAIFGILIIVIYLITILGSKENPSYIQARGLDIKTAFKTTLSNRPFLIFAFANLFVQYSFVIVLASVPFFAKYLLKIPAGDVSLLFFSTFGVAGIMMFVWRRIIVRIGAKNSYLFAVIFLAGALFPFFFIDGFYLALICSGLIGIGVAGLNMIADIIISDIVDWDFSKTKERREGIYFGANNFITRLAIGLEVACMGSIFFLTNYLPGQIVQTKEFLLGLRFLISGFPILALAAAFLIMLFYPLGNEQLIELRKNLEKA